MGFGPVAVLRCCALKAERHELGAQKRPLNFELGRESVFFLGLFGSGAAGAAPDVLLEAARGFRKPVS